ncbi:MAG TPA: hypothetical protein VIW78_03055 [Burkholderiales bacterium]
MNKKLAAIAVTAVATFASSPPVTAAEVAGVFSKGSTSLAIIGGSGYAFNQSYLVLGLGVGYYVIDGLNVGLSVESWSGANPTLYKVTPSVQYVFHQIPHLKPYIGTFYRRTYVENQSDINSWGGRAGAYLSAGRSAYVGFGAVYESYIDCNKTVYHSCSDTYPEVSFTISF